MKTQLEKVKFWKKRKKKEMKMEKKGTTKGRIWLPRKVLLNLKRRAKMGKIRKEEVMEMKTQLEKVKFWKKRKKKEMKMEKKGEPEEDDDDVNDEGEDMAAKKSTPEPQEEGQDGENKEGGGDGNEDPVGES